MLTFIFLCFIMVLELIIKKDLNMLMKVSEIEIYNHKVKEFVLAKAKGQQEDKRRRIEINNNDVSDVSCGRKKKVCVFDGKKYIDIEVNLKNIIK